MSCKTKPCQNSRESVRMVHAMPLATPRPPKFHLKVSKNHGENKNRVSPKNCFFAIPVGHGEVWGCPGGGGGPYEDIVSNFGRIWSHRTWGKSISMFFGNIGNTLHHQIPPNWSSGLQIGPRIFSKPGSHLKCYQINKLSKKRPRKMFLRETGQTPKIIISC